MRVVESMKHMHRHTRDVPEAEQLLHRTSSVREEHPDVHVNSFLTALAVHFKDLVDINSTVFTIC